MTRRNFIQNLSSAAGFACVGTTLAEVASSNSGEDALDVGQRETDLVKPEVYRAYLADGKTRDLATLEKLERGFAKIVREIETTKVGATPAVWLVYNMGVVVKTRQALFSIDLAHRRAVELAPKLDFALITHNHGDHYSPKFYRAMDGAGKTVINNFIDNYGAADWRKGGKYWAAGGFTRAEKTFKIKDVEIRTALTDHNPYLVDYTTTFEIRVGNWRMFHSGDCGNAQKLKTIWGQPDLWVVFPGCGLNVKTAFTRIQPKLMAFGHLWELAHGKGRLTTPMVRRARKTVESAGGSVVVPLYGERIV